jgi:hypothetical protein
MQPISFEVRFDRWPLSLRNAVSRELKREYSVRLRATWATRRYQVLMWKILTKTLGGRWVKPPQHAKVTVGAHNSEVSKRCLVRQV